MQYEANHFTTAKYALKNVEHQRIKIARLKELEDPYELSAVCIKDMPYQAINREILIRELDKTDGIICFSANYWSTLMWGITLRSIPEHGWVLRYLIHSNTLEKSKLLEVKYNKELLMLDIDEKKPILNSEIVKDILKI